MTEQDIIDAAVTVYNSTEFESEHDLRLSVKGFVRGVIYMNDYIRSTMNAALIDESSLRRRSTVSCTEDADTTEDAKCENGIAKLSKNLDSRTDDTVTQEAVNS